MPDLSLTFLGAAGTVTGSKHLLEVDGRRILVDCGLFQGLKELRVRNWEPLPVEAASIDAVILTHAHLDHCGYLPRLVSAGFRGRIYCTPATKELCSLVLPDSAHIQEEDARDANRHGFSKHSPALPLYTSVDADRALTQLQPVGYDRPVPIMRTEAQTSDGPTVEFINAGHLLGSAYARVRVAGTTILFGGDLGRYGRPVLPDPGIPFQLVHHDDVAAAMRAAVLGRGKPGVYNLAGAGELSVRQLAEELGWYSIPVPDLAVDAVAEMIGRLGFLPAQAQWIAAFREPVIMSTAKARSQLRWRPKHDALETLRETITATRMGRLIR